MTVRNAVEQANRPGVGALVEQYRGDFTLVLPSHIKADQWIRVAQGALRRDPKLARAAKANPGSLLSSLLRCAHLGLEPGDTFHLVPFGTEVTGITDYTGEIELMYRAGEVVSVVAELVHKGDTFIWSPGRLDDQIPARWEGPMTRPHHDVDWFGDRGEMVGVYAYGILRSGAISRVVVMGHDEVMKHKSVSKSAGSADSPWKKWPGSMWLKTVVHELRKWVPTSAEYRTEVLRAEAAIAEVAADRPELPIPGGDEDYIEGEVIDDEPPTEVDQNGELPLPQGDGT